VADVAKFEIASNMPVLAFLFIHTKYMVDLLG